MTNDGSISFDDLSTTQRTFWETIDPSSDTYASLKNIAKQVANQRPSAPTAFPLNAAAENLANGLKRLRTSKTFQAAVASLTREADLQKLLDAFRFEVPASAVRRTKTILASLEPSGPLAEIKQSADVSLEALRQQVVGDIGGPGTRLTEDRWLEGKFAEGREGDNWTDFLVIFTFAYPHLAPSVVAALHVVGRVKSDAKSLGNGSSSARTGAVVGGAALAGSPLAQSAASYVVAIIIYITLALMHDPESGESDEESP